MSAGKDTATRAAIGAVLCLLLPGALHAEQVTASVGQLLIPAVRHEDGYRRHFLEYCSATLVSAAPAPHSRFLLTAWHCLEYYGDLSRAIRYRHADGQEREARQVASGGGMHADWALLRLADALPGPVALSGPVTDTVASLALAGYSRPDPAQPRDADAATPLLVDRDCRVIGGDGADVRTNCHARRGASGGAAFRGDSYAGVISRGDSDRISIYVPLERIWPRISPYLGPLPDPRIRDAASPRDHRRPDQS